MRTYSALVEPLLDAKLRQAQAGFELQRRMSFSDRAGQLLAAADLFEVEKDSLAALMTQEMGKPIAQARAEAAKCATACRFYAEHAEAMLADEPVPHAEGHCHVRYEPLGPVLAIMPWNFPFWQVVRAAAPALMAGNVVLLKHAPNVPECALALEDVFRRAGLSLGAFQNLFLETDSIPAVIEDPRVAAVTLTGSVRAGRTVGALAGRCLKPCVLELGGNDPFVVMPSAPLEATVAHAAKARVQNNGQSCIAAKRFIVHEQVYAEFEARYVEAFRRLRVGDPMLADTDVGPLVSARAVDDLEAQVRRAVKLGARILCGGQRRPGPGFFFEPTVLAGTPVSGDFAAEELFGPVAQLFRVADFDEAIQVANATPYGLGASLWTQDSREQERGIRDLRAGQVFVNGVVASQPALSFGGMRDSGLGRELGAPGLRAFVNAKSVSLA
jgi:succinate-semialdehyde dehydrogenase/glutarate-semialdehyde dehydrogenase